MTAMLRYWAAARDAAGCAEERVVPGTLRDVLADAVERHGARLGEVLLRCSFLVDGAPVGAREHAQVMIQPASVVEVLPPFAGG